MKLRVYNKTLDPNIWGENKTLKPEVRDALLKIAEDFYNTTDLKAEIQNILFLGSSANYNWTPNSDIDLHVVIDIAGEKIHEDYARKFMDGLSFKWNSEHSIEVKGHPVEIYLQDVREPNSTSQQARPGSAIYSLFDDKWMLEPNPQNIKLDADKIRQKFHQLKKSITTLIETQNVDHMKKLMKSIRNYRDAGLAEGGEFSVENLVFKALRYSGDLAKLKDTIIKLYDKSASLPEGGNIQPDKKTEPLKENEGKPFIVVGSINGDLDIKSEIDYVGATGNYWNTPVMHSGHGYIDWRYKSKTNTVYWKEEMNARMKDAVKIYLDRKYGIINSKHSNVFQDYMSQGHYVNETENKPFLIVGMVFDDLSVKTVVDYKGAIGNFSNANVRHKTNDMYGGIRFRYNSTDNTIYWWSPEYSRLNDNQKNAVIKDLKLKYGIVNPKEEASTEKYKMRGHKLNEDLIRKDANLYLGFINRETFKVIGTDVHDEGLTHANWQPSLPKEYQWYFGTEALLWRYKREPNTVYWWSTFPEPNEDEKRYVDDWLFKHANIKYPTHQMISWAKDPESMDKRISAHTFGTTGEPYTGMDENINKFLVVGFVNGDLQIIADVDETGKLDHEAVLKNHPEFEKGQIDDLAFWRYKSLTNMLTWLLKKPTDQQRHSVVTYLHSKLSIGEPRQELGQYGGEAYKIDENTDRLVKWIFTKNS